MSENIRNRNSTKQNIIIISVIIYSIALLFFAAMFLKAGSSIKFYNSILASYSQPLPAYSNPPEIPEVKSLLAIGQLIKEIEVVISQKPTNLDIDYELMGLAKKHDLKIVSLSFKGNSKQTIVQGSYEVQSFSIVLAGAKQDIIDLLGDLQSFRLGPLVIDNIALSEKKGDFQADISFSVYSRETMVGIPDSEPIKEKMATISNLDVKKVVGRQ